MGLRWRLNDMLVRSAVRMIKWTGWYEGYWNHWRGAAFERAERRGLHILPVHFYTPIPSTRDLDDDLWADRAEAVGIDLQLDAAMSMLNQLAKCYQAEWRRIPDQSPNGSRGFSFDNRAFGRGDAEALYGMVRRLKPQRVVEIGSGYSTLLIAEALRAGHREEEDYRCAFTAIEPYPPACLARLPEEVTRLIVEPVQRVDMDLFTSLQAGDILFIDSSHVVRAGSDVVFEYLQVLPRIAPGVVVHIHDIFIPDEYPRDWIFSKRFFWNEQYLLQAFMAGNSAFEVILPMHALWRMHRPDVQRCIPSLVEHDAAPSSFWIRKRD